MSLDLKVPPPGLALVLAGAMYGVSWAFPELRFQSRASHALAVALAVAGLGFFVPAALAILRHRTTIDPRKPERSSTLVTRGIYRASRNPIYLGDVLLLLAWATYLGAPLAYAAVPLFVWWMNRFQIGPEERILAAKFGDEYRQYCRRVRRWL